MSKMRKFCDAYTLRCDDWHELASVRANLRAHDEEGVVVATVG